ncbi:carbonic anhydrase [Planococcus maritimus]|uniref:ATP-grasp fold amidoligase family protein n=1 Tax=Planococcus maritimus TaxID=192421 RepID=UPI0031392578
MDYKKVFKNQETRFKILRLMKFIPDKTMISIQYKMKLGRTPNLISPERYTEKLQWYKLNYRTPLLTQASDKYAVREYIKSKGLEGILTKLYGVYKNPNEIELKTLPEKFVMKTTNGSGTNYLCKNKAEFPINEIKESLNKWLKRDIYSSGREWCYKNIEPKIIVEEFLEDNANQFDGINDYKFICFNGKPQYVVLDVDRHVKHKRNIYDLEWNLLEVSTDHSNIDRVIPKPMGLEKMIEVAETLSKDFPHVRVDLYWVNGKVYFGELTFYPWTGYVQFSPDEFDLVLGNKFSLPSI